MRTHRRNHRRRIAALVLAAMVVPVVAAPAAALAVPADLQYPRPVPAPVSPTPSDLVKIGDTPADFGQPVALAPSAGDTKFDSPGASRAPEYDPTHTIQVVRPERTIVRGGDGVLPIALSGAALLVAIGLAGTALIRVRSLRLG